MTSELTDKDMDIMDKLGFPVAKDTRVYLITTLVNSLLAKPELLNDEMKSKIAAICEPEPEMKRLPELLDLVVQRVKEPHAFKNGVTEIPTKVHISFGPKATRETAIEAYFDLFDPIRREKFMEGAEPLDFGDLNWKD